MQEGKTGRCWWEGRRGKRSFPGPQGPTRHPFGSLSFLPQSKMTQHPGARAARLAPKQRGSLKDKRESKLLEKANLGFGSTPLFHNSGISDIERLSLLSSPTALLSPSGLRCLQRVWAGTSETGKTAKELVASLFPIGGTVPLPAKLPPPVHLGSGRVFSVPTSLSLLVREEGEQHPTATL